MIANAAILVVGTAVWLYSLKIQDEAHQTMAAALRQREEAAAFYAQAIVRNDEAIAAQLEAGRMLEAARAITQEHSP